MTNITTEHTFDSAIELSLIEKGNYTKGNAEDYSPELGMFKYEVIKFLQESQSKRWERITTIRGADVNYRVIQRLYKELDLRGSLDVLRNGFVDYGVRFQMAYWQQEIEDFANIYFDPETKLNNPREKKKLYAYTDPAVDRFKAIEEEEKRDEIKKGLRFWTNLYAFLFQITNSKT